MKLNTITFVLLLIATLFFIVIFYALTGFDFTIVQAKWMPEYLFPSQALLTLSRFLLLAQIILILLIAHLFYWGIRIIKPKKEQARQSLKECIRLSLIILCIVLMVYCLSRPQLLTITLKSSISPEEARSITRELGVQLRRYDGFFIDIEARAFQIPWLRWRSEHCAEIKEIRTYYLRAYPQ